MTTLSQGKVDNRGQRERERERSKRERETEGERERARKQMERGIRRKGSKQHEREKTVEAKWGRDKDASSKWGLSQKG